ncbi:hypothetical protein H7691_06750 [Stenotrophomonas sp. CW117]|uniref:hypothetical protein n=1 Tax=Stenotrophomonas TaxID=40323 RepID=UPI00178023A9|nr:hypothetical protein [Stenotrophomonas sp. CW117]QOF99805.1 hypothetical protein H7691_06750 [Stenotrophomonas sp. CW117]
MASDAQIWPFGGAGEVYWQAEWLTDVLQPSAGLAQHRRLRAHPRVRVGFDGLVSGAARRWLENLLERNGGRLWRVPLPGVGFSLAAPAPAGSLTLSGVAAGTFVSAGMQVAVVPEDPRLAEVVTVDEVLADGVTLVSATVNAHVTGAKVLPLFEGRLSSVPVLSRFTADAAPWGAEFDLTTPLPIVADAGATLYRSWPVLELPVVWSADPAWQSHRELVSEDNETGPVWVTDLLGQSRQIIRRSYTATGAGEVSQLLALLWALAGRGTPVWVHTQGQDLVLAASAGAAATTLDVQWAGLGTGPRPPGRRDLRIALRNGTVIRRRVTAVAAPNAATERLTLDAALGTSITPADVVQISWMALCTQAADVVRINWWTHDVAVVDLSFQAVPHEH